jgi:hypothetical protein
MFGSKAARVMETSWGADSDVQEINAGYLSFLVSKSVSVLSFLVFIDHLLQRSFGWPIRGILT